MGVVTQAEAGKQLLLPLEEVLDACALCALTPSRLPDATCARTAAKY